MLSVVIPTCARNDLLAQCLERLAPGAQTLPAADYEVVVTDDGGSTNARELLHSRFPWARWIQGPRRGPASNRNHGALAATSKWIVFCDDDCLPTPGFLEAYVRAIADHPTTKVFEGRTSADRPKRHPLEGAPINQVGGHLWSCNLAIEVAFFRELGGFNEVFPFAAMEDMDFCKRLKQMGVVSRFVPEAEIIHPWRMLDLVKHTRRHVASQLIYARLHPEDRHLFTVWQHCKNVARYYVRDFPAELRDFGWLALRCQPLRWWEAVYRGWHFAFGEKAAAASVSKP
jgi:GT2 family glycosyltransferase